jgi:hypothetical protein
MCDSDLLRLRAQHAERPGDVPALLARARRAYERAAKPLASPEPYQASACSRTRRATPSPPRRR